MPLQDPSQGGIAARGVRALVAPVARDVALKNCMLMAGKRIYKKSPDMEHWQHVLRFCAQVGITPSPLRDWHGVRHGAMRNAERAGETIDGETLARRALAAGIKAYLAKVGFPVDASGEVKP